MEVVPVPGGHLPVLPPADRTGQSHSVPQSCPPPPPEVLLAGDEESGLQHHHVLLIAGLTADLASVLHVQVRELQLRAKALSDHSVPELVQLRDVRLVEGPHVVDVPEAGADLAGEDSLAPCVRLSQPSEKIVQEMYLVFTRPSG